MSFSRKISRVVLSFAFAAAAVSASAQPAAVASAVPAAAADHRGTAKKQAVTGYVAGFLESSPMQIIIELEQPLAGRSRINVSEAMFSKADRQDLRANKRVDLNVQVVSRDGQPQVKVLSARIFKPAGVAPRR